MTGEVELVYSAARSYECSQLSEFLRLCGIYAYETSIDFEDSKWMNGQTTISKKIYLPNKEQEAKTAEKLKENNFLFCENAGLKEIDDLLVFLTADFCDDQNLNYLKNFYCFFVDNNLYETLYVSRYVIRHSDFLKDAIDNTEKALHQILMWEMKGKNSEGTLCYTQLFCSVKLWVEKQRMYRKKAWIEERRTEQTQSDLQETQMIERYCRILGEQGYEGSTVKELLGDVWFEQSDYLRSYPAYQSCTEEFNYTAPWKLTEYLRDVNPNWQAEEKYLKIAVIRNHQMYEAWFRLGKQAEDNSNTNLALQYYEKIVLGLEEKEKCNCLRPDEMVVLCRTLKRIGCIKYKSTEKEEECKTGIAYYHRTFQIWNQCRENQFLMHFSERCQELLRDYFYETYYLRGTIASLFKIYRILGNVEKKEKCAELMYDDKLEQMKNIPVEEI